MTKSINSSSFLPDSIEAMFENSGPQFSTLSMNMIEVKDQHREIFESEDNTLAELAASIAARGILQPILVRPLPNKNYQLIAGERRFRAAKLAGLELIPAYIREMTDEEADDAQLAENIQRLNLTQIEEAKKIQRDLDTLGSTDAVLEKHQKSRTWLSKILSLVNLPEQAKRLITENISADVDLINKVKVMEKVDPVETKALVDDLKKTRGKENARDKVDAAKERIKPSKKSSKGKLDNVVNPAKDTNNDSGEVATAKDRSLEAPTGEKIIAGSKVQKPISIAEVLNGVYVKIFEEGRNPTNAIEALRDQDQLDAVEGYLEGFFEAGKQSRSVAIDVVHGFRKGQFSSDGDGAFALIAFLDGSQENSKFSVLNIFDSVKEA